MRSGGGGGEDWKEEGRNRDAYQRLRLCVCFVLGGKREDMKGGGRKGMERMKIGPCIPPELQR